MSDDLRIGDHLDIDVNDVHLSGVVKPNVPPREAPCMPVEMPDLRNELIAKWGTDKGWRIAELQSQIYASDSALQLPTMLEAHNKTKDAITDDVLVSIRANIVGLAQSELFWVGPEMCQLLFNTTRQVTDDVETNHLKFPATFGLVVFARPWRGLDARSTETPMVKVDAVTWGLAQAKSVFDGSMRDVVNIACYRCIKWEDGLEKEELQLATSMGLHASAKRGTTITRTDEHGAESLSIVLKGKSWMPLGRSSWPIGERVDSFVTRAQTDEEMQFGMSCAEDRRLIAALFTLLDTTSLAEVNEVKMPRHIARREMRETQVPRKEPSKVRVIYLRHPKHKVAGDQGEAKHVEWSHRWVVSSHPRLQPYGPGRSQRKLIIVPAHVKGPEDKELIVKDSVYAWVR